MHACVVYSSLTGNTRSVAEHLASRFGLPLFSLKDAPSPAAYDTYILGFWTRRGAPDPGMAAFMRTLKGRRTFFFGTMAAYPDSRHALGCAERAAKLLAEGQNRIMGHFLCQGRLDPAVFAKSRHPKTPERLQRIRCAAAHPNADDFAEAEERVRAAFGQEQIGRDQI